MRKLLRKAVSVLLTVAMFCIATVPAMATNDGNTEPENVITQMKYIVYDKDGNIRETGTTPDPTLRYSWEGITLYNGEWVEFLQTNGRPFTIARGTPVTFRLELSRAASMFTLFVETNYNASSTLGYYESWTSVGNPAFIGFTWDSSISGYCYPQTTNQSSDPVTIVEARLTF